MDGITPWTSQQDAIVFRTETEPKILTRLCGDASRVSFAPSFLLMTFLSFYSFLLICVVLLVFFILILQTKTKIFLLIILFLFSSQLGR